ncbi:MAG TPA: type II secretion system F family protein [Patescibacteria group bacterium]|nr:type II secretion system F family protein [Patescibacteria group bacterium]
MKDQSDVLKIDKNASLSSGDKIALISNLSTMLTAGIPILDAVNNLLEDSKGNNRKVLETLRDDLTQGHQVNYSLAKFPRIFDKVTVNVIKASEEAGTLDITLKDLRETLRKQNEFNDSIRSALLYPTFIIGVFILVLLLNLLFVIPKITLVFRNLRVALPLPTRILISISDFMTHNTVSFLIGLAVFVLFIIYLFTQKRSFLLNIIYSIPGISGLIKLVDLTRFTRSLHLLLSSGLPIVAALDLASDIVMRKETKKIIDKSKEMILSGKTFSDGLRTAKGYIPTIMIKLVETGEKTGSLDKSLQDISEYFDYQVTNTLKTLTALLEPIMLVFVGILVGGMMISIIAPIYGLIANVSPH